MARSGLILAIMIVAAMGFSASALTCNVGTILAGKNAYVVRAYLHVMASTALL